MKVFISYRREDSAGAAGRLYDHLCLSLGEDNVFSDVDNIPLGVDFRKVIQEAISKCDVVLTVIGKLYTRVTDKDGKPRLFKDNDFVHLEVRNALEQGKRIIPLLVNQAQMPGPEELPSALQSLAYLNAYELRHEKWRDDVRELGRILGEILDQTGPGGASSSQPLPTIEEIDTLFQAREYDRVLSILNDQYLKKNPDDYLGWTLLGHTYEKLDEDDRAEKAYRKALSLHPDSEKALTGMGILYRKKRNYAQSADYYQQALAINPDYAQAHSSLSVIELKRRNFRKAVQHAEKAFALDKEDPVIASNLAVCHHYAGNRKKRDEFYQTAANLGYPSLDTLKKIFSGELTVLD